MHDHFMHLSYQPANAQSIVRNICQGEADEAGGEQFGK